VLAIPTVVIAGPTALLLSAVLVAGSSGWVEMTDPAGMLLATLPLSLGAVIVAVAAGTVLASGARLRAVGLALVPLAGLALLGADSAGGGDRFQRPAPFAYPANVIHGATTQFPATVGVKVDVVPHSMITPPPLPTYSAQIATASRPQPAAGLPNLWRVDPWNSQFSWAQAAPAVGTIICLVAVLAVVAMFSYGAEPAGPPVGEYWLR
jgi:hypothetical protein